jgi:hypothetical protein
MAVVSKVCALASADMREELQSVFQTVIRDFIYVKKQSINRKTVCKVK